MSRIRIRDFGQSMKFDGGTTRVTLSNRLVISGAFTYTMWVKPNFTNPASPSGFFIGDSSTDIKIGFNGTSNLSARIVSGGNLLPSNFVVSHNQWTFLALRRNADNSFEISLNGGSFVTFNGALNTAGNTAISIIGATNVGQNFRGNIDSVHIYNGIALTNADVSTIFTRGTYPSGESVVYTFNDGAGVATDTSGNNNNGVLIAPTYTSDVPMTNRVVATGGWVQRDFLASLRFPGSTAHVRATTIPGLNTGCTFAAWFTTESLSAGSRNIIENSLSTSQRLVMMRDGSTIRAGYWNGSAYTSKSSTPLKTGQWYFGVFTWDGTATQLYINGVAQSGTDTPASSLGGALTIGARADNNTFNWWGNIADVMIWNRALTSPEASALYLEGRIPSGLVARYKLDEGAGSTANDSSGNNNHGTITGASFVADVPMKARQSVNRDLVVNGNFEYAPPFVAAGNPSGAWIDGTANGSATNSLFGWAVFARGNAANTISFDSIEKYSGQYSLKLSLAGNDTSVQAMNSPSILASDIAKYGIPIIPGTSYTLTYRMKTVKNGGGTGTGASVEVNQRGISGSVIATSFSSSAVNTSTDWTAYSISFTPPAMAIFGTLKLKLDGSQGLNMDAWFDDITLTCGIPISRQLLT